MAFVFTVSSRSVSATGQISRGRARPGGLDGQVGRATAAALSYSGGARKAAAGDGSSGTGAVSGGIKTCTTDGRCRRLVGGGFRGSNFFVPTRLMDAGVNG